MDYEKKYKEALAHAREIHRNEDEKRRDMEFIFPELKESEDEKVRKTLIDFFGRGAKYGGHTNGVYDKDILAWLEKQKGNLGGISANWSEDDEKIINGLIDSLTRISLNTRTDSTSPNYMFYKEIDWLKSLKERIGGKI